MPKQITLSLRMYPEMHVQLKDEHARTFSVHRLSFNAWLIYNINLLLLRPLEEAKK